MTIRLGFHYPNALATTASGGSSLRPAKMFEAFTDLGCEVLDLTGESPRRSGALRAARSAELDAVYSECVTVPTVLADADHRPRHPLADPRFFQHLRDRGVPSGLFYRDVYWRFPEYREALAPARRIPTIAAYAADLWWYRRYVDVLFLPSVDMAEVLPAQLRHPRPVALPPGASPHSISGTEDGDRGTPPSTNELRTNELRVFYVGSTLPPFYDIDWLLGAVTSMDQARLRLCCPESERSRLLADPRASDPRVEIIHESADQLLPHYRWADLASVAFAPHPYRSFSMPIKAFEAIGAGVPLLATRATAIGSLVERDALGFPVENAEHLLETLRRLAASGDELRTVTDRVRAASELHTWRRRAEQVLEELLGSGSALE